MLQTLEKMLGALKAHPELKRLLTHEARFTTLYERYFEKRALGVVTDERRRYGTLHARARSGARASDLLEHSVLAAPQSIYQEALEVCAMLESAYGGELCDADRRAACDEVWGLMSLGIMPLAPSSVTAGVGGGASETFESDYREAVRRLERAGVLYDTLEDHRALTKSLSAYEGDRHDDGRRTTS